MTPWLGGSHPTPRLYQLKDGQCRPLLIELLLRQHQEEGSVLRARVLDGGGADDETTRTVKDKVVYI
jgi:hypothetical protein